MLPTYHRAQATISLIIFLIVTPCCLAGFETKPQNDSKDCQASPSAPIFDEVSTQTDSTLPFHPEEEITALPPWVKKKAASTTKYESVSSANRFTDACRAFNLELTEQETAEFLDRNNCRRHCKNSFESFSNKYAGRAETDKAVTYQKDYMHAMKDLGSLARKDCVINANYFFNNINLITEANKYCRSEFLKNLFVLVHSKKKDNYSTGELRKEILSDVIMNLYHEPFSHLKGNVLPGMLDKLHQTIGQPPKSLSHYRNYVKNKPMNVAIDDETLLQLTIDRFYEQKLKTGIKVTEALMDWQKTTAMALKIRMELEADAAERVRETAAKDFPTRTVNAPSGIDSDKEIDIFLSPTSFRPTADTTKNNKSNSEEGIQRVKTTSIQDTEERNDPEYQHALNASLLEHLNEQQAYLKKLETKYGIIPDAYTQGSGSDHDIELAMALSLSMEKHEDKDDDFFNEKKLSEATNTSRQRRHHK